MVVDSQYGQTLLVKKHQADTNVHVLERVHFTSNGPEGSAYNEKWLQMLIMDQPGLLPIRELEPAFVDMVPICTELPMRAGFLDNLFVTPNGDLALVECKLWRNPEARRKVLAQIIDYASELATWNYEKLEIAIKHARLHAKEARVGKSLFEIVASPGQLNEVGFHDAVSRNLRRGRMHLLIVGDGIHQGLETLAAFLQQHAGQHFTLSLVELALFKMPECGGLLVQPRILARTTNIERVVVTMATDLPQNNTVASSSMTAPVRGETLTEAEFFERLARSSPGSTTSFRLFLQEIEPLHVKPDVTQKTLTLRWYREADSNWNLGTVTDDGEVWMDYHGIQAQNANRTEASREYLGQLAELVPGAVVRMTRSRKAWNLVDAAGHSLRIDDLLTTDHAREIWVRAIRQFQLAVAT